MRPSKRRNGASVSGASTASRSWQSSSSCCDLRLSSASGASSALTLTRRRVSATATAIPTSARVARRRSDAYPASTVAARPRVLCQRRPHSLRFSLRREQQLREDAPALKVSGEWQDAWEQRESQRQQLEAPSFARLVQGGFAATGPAVGSTERISNTSCGSQSPVPSPAWPCAASGAAVPAGGAWGLAPAACGVPPSRGCASLLHGTPTAAAAAAAAADLEDELGSPPPSLGAGWAAASVSSLSEVTPAAPPAGGSKRKGKAKGQSLLSNSGGRKL